MEDFRAHSEPIKNIFNLDYLFEKCSRYIKNSFNSYTRLYKYIDQIIQLSTNNFSVDHLSYANDIIECLAENFLIQPNCTYYLKRMLALCLVPPSVNSITECSTSLPTLVRFYDIMAKCIRLVHAHQVDLSTLLFGVVQLSVLRRQPVPENSIGLHCCQEAIETSCMPETLMDLVKNTAIQTVFVDLLRLSFNLAAISDRSAQKMMRSDGINVLVAALKPNFLLIPLNSHERLIVCEYVVLLLNRMFSLKASAIAESPRITRDTLEIIFCNIKIETERNVSRSMKMRNDFCYVLAEIVNHCVIDESEFSNDMITDIVMLCVWPEIIRVTHWLDSVRFDYANENFIFKTIMLDIVYKVFIVRLSRKTEFQLLNTFLIKEFMLLLNVEYSKKTYGGYVNNILDGLLLNLPYLLLNSIDSSIKNDCCTQLMALTKSLRSQECFSCTMINIIICVGIASNDDCDLLRKFKDLKADVLINSVILDTLKDKNYNFQDIHLYGLNTLNVFYRENHHNPEGQLMVFNMIMRMVKLYLIEDAENKIDQNLVLDLLHFIKNAIIRYSDQVEHFVIAGGIEQLLIVLPTVKYAIQLVILTTLVDLAMYRSTKSRIKNWKCAKTKRGYLELMCDIWRREKVKFNFIDDEFMFREQRERTTVANLMDGCSPTVESMFLCAQPKIYLLLHLVEFPDGKLERCRDYSYENDVRENTVRTCRLVPGFQDKATVAHIYHYYPLKLGEVWNENDLLSNDPDDVLSAVESQSIDIMMVRHVYLMALIKMIQREVTNINVGDSEIKLENKLYEEIRRYHSKKN